MPKKRVLAVAVAMALGAPAYEGWAQSIAPTTLPTGGRIVAGQASITTNGASMAIQQTTSKAALDWQSFSIGSQAAVRFNQPSASSIALNRVLGNDGSQILGRLSANGQVFLVNPNGILFGRGAQVDVGGILASTLNLSADDFMSGRYLLRNPGNGSIVNQGSIKGGYAAFVGPNITNDGTIEAQHGTVALAAANAATVDLLADGLVQIRVDEGALAAQIANNGVIRADGGVVTLTAAAKDSLARSVVNNTGIIEARTVEMADGVVRLGGIKLLADEVNVTGKSRLDASGDAGGGEILIGGNYQGRGPEANALTTTVGPDVVVSADAHKAGDGGKVILWSNDSTRFHGSISARGGATGGNGGFVETSGGTLWVTGTADTSAVSGRRGTWLLDPKFITVTSTGGSAYAPGTNNLYSNDPTGTSIITPASINGAASDVVLQANTDITFAEAVSISAGGVGLTAQAGRSVLVNASITTNNGNVTLVANDRTANGVVDAQRDPGIATINTTGGAINAGTGAVNITLRDGQGLTNADSGAITLGSITAGSLTVQNQGPTPGAGAINVNGAISLSGALTLDASGPLTISKDISSGTQSFTTSSGGILVTNDDPTVTMSVFSSGTQTFNSATDLIVRGASTPGSFGSVMLSSAGLQTLTASDSIQILTRSGGSGTAFANVTSSGGQALNAAYLYVKSESGNALLSNSSGTQSITTFGSDGFDGLAVLSFASGASASITNSGTAQNIAVNGVNHDLTIIGSTGSSGANIDASGASSQSISVAGFLHLDGSFGGSPQIRNLGSGDQIVSATGIGILGGNQTNAIAQITSSSTSGAQTVTAGSVGLSLQGGTAAGGGASAFITQASAAAQSVTVNNGALSLMGGSTNANNNAGITNTNAAGTQTITVNNGPGVSVLAQAGTAFINSSGGQAITIQGASSTNALVVGGASAANGSGITGNNQSITAGTSGQPGSITLQGGTAAAKNSFVTNNSGTQTISTSGSLMLLGGSAVGSASTCNPSLGAGSCGAIANNGAGLQTVTAGTVQLSGGTSGVGNGAGIFINAASGTQQVNVGAGGLTMTAGSGTSDNFVSIGGGNNNQTITVNVTGNTVLNGGSTSGSSAFIGMLGSTANLSSTVNFSGTGNLTLNGGGVTAVAGTAIAGIGAGGNLPNATATINVNANNIALNDGTGSIARIGHSGSNNGPGDISVTAAGSFVMNASNAVGTTMRTTGNVTLSASSINQSAASLIAGGGSISTTSSGATTLAGTITADSPTGPATVDVSGGTVTANGAVITVTGGSSGNLGVHPANVNITAGIGGINWSGGSISAAGGSNAAPANKDDANITFGSPGGFVTVANTTFSTSGFNPQIDLGATGNVSVSTSTLTATATQETATMSFESLAGNVSITNSTLTTTGAASGTQANNADVSGIGMVARHDITLSSATLNATGGSGQSRIEAFAAGHITGSTFVHDGGGNLNIDHSSIGSGSGASLPWNGKVGGVYFDADNITVGPGTGVGANGTGVMSINATGALNVTAGSGTSESAVLSSANDQSLTVGSITVTGGANGTGNSANISTNTGTQTITTTGNVTINAGLGGTSNGAVIAGRHQNITIHGSLALTGGGSAPAATGSGARLGGPGGGAAAPTDLTLAVDGDIILTGGSVAGATGAAIGSSPTATAQQTDISITARDVSLTSGSASAARIGGFDGTAGGNITITAQGNIALNAGTAIRTAGNVTLHADQAGKSITEAPSAVILANVLTTTSSAGTSLDGIANAITSFNASNAASGNISLTNSGLLTVTGISQLGGGDVTLTADKMVLSGPITAGVGTVTLQPATISTAIDVGSITDSQANTLELSTAELATITTSGVLQVGRTDGTGTLKITQQLPTTAVNAGTLRLVHGDVVSDSALNPGSSIGAPAGAEFAHHVELLANNHVQLTGNGVYIADSRNLTVTADLDNNGTGNAILGAGQFTIKVGTTGANTGSMAVTGANVNITPGGAIPSIGLITVMGSGTQNFRATKGDININNSNPDGSLTISTAGGAQTFDTVTGALSGSTGQMTVQGPGSVGSSGTVQVSGGTQSINLLGDLSLTAGASSVLVQNQAGAQTIAAKGISILGGAGANGMAQLSNPSGIGQSITIGADGLTITGGSSTSGNSSAFIANNAGAQSIVVNGGNVSLLGGTNFASNSATIASSGTQSITVNDAASVSVAARAAQAGFNAAGNQTILMQGATSANAFILGAAGAVNNAFVSGQNQSITVGTGTQSGSITIRGGATAGKNVGFASTSGTQNVSTSGTLTLIGGSATGTSGCSVSTSGSCAFINDQSTGLQTVTANAISLQAGNTGIANGAGIFISGGNQIINVGAGGLSLQGGSGGTENGASIGGAPQSGKTITVNVAGNTVLNGGANTGSSAFIGMGGTGSGNSVTVNFNGTGDLTLNGGGASTAAAGIGGGGNQTNATTTVNISAANITLNDGTGSVARFGHGGSVPGPGDITVTATGDLAFNALNGNGSFIRTTGNVTLHADSPGKLITQGPASGIEANTLTVTSNSGISLNGSANLISAFSATNALNGISLVNTASPLTIGNVSNAGIGPVSVTNSGPISITGTLASGSGGVTLSSSGAITESGLGKITTNGALNTTSTGGLTLGGANAVSQLNASNTSSGDITLTNAAPLNIASIGSAPGGSVSIANTGGLLVNGPIATTGAGNITLVGDNFGVGPGVAIGSTAAIAANGTGSISITGTAHGAGGGVFIGSSVNAPNGNVTIDGTGGMSSDASGVPGVIIGSPTVTASVFAGNTLTIVGQGGTATGSGTSASAQGVGLNKANVDANGQVIITGFGGSSATQGAAGVIISNGTHVGGSGPVTINGSGGTAGGSSGGSAVGVIVGSQVDTVGSEISSMGLVTITGIGGTGNNTGATGIAVFGPTGSQSIVESLGGIAMDGAGGNVPTGVGSAVGVSLLNALVQTASLNGDPTPRHISITGVGGSSNGGNNATGIGVADGSRIQTQGIAAPELGGFQTGFGDITLDGTGGNAALGGGANGVGISNFNTASGALLQTNTGSVFITGLAGTSATGEARGIVVRAASTVESSGGGALSLTGTGGTSNATGTASVSGVAIGGQALVQTSGDIALMGIGGTNLGAGSAAGVGVADGALVHTFGAGALSVTGMGGSATSGGSAHGIAVQPFATTTAGQLLTDQGTMTLTGTAGSPSTSSSAINIVDAIVSTNTGAMNLDATGTLSIAASGSFAMVSSGGLQTVNATGLSIKGAAGGSGGHAFLSSSGGQDVTVGAGGISMTGGNGTNTGVEIFQQAPDKDQTITVNGGGGMVLTGGGGTDSGADILNNGVAQTITFTSGGTLTLQGGSGAGGGNKATIENFGTGATLQTIAFPAGGAVNLRGGTVGIDNFAEIGAMFGDQTVSGTADITLTGGASGGGVNVGNTASIGLSDTPTAVQTISARNIVLTGGSGGSENMAAIGANVSGQTQTINATGSVTLAGGAGTDAAAVIGIEAGDVNIAITAAGPITLASGTGATSTFGAIAGIGTFGGGAGSVTVTGGGIALGSGLVQTAGNVVLASSGQITQTTGTVNAASLAATSATGTALTGANTVQTFSGINTTSGAVSFRNTAPTLTVSSFNQSATGAVSLSNTGALVVGGAINATGASVALSSTDTLTSGSSADIVTPSLALIAVNGISVLNSHVNALTVTNTNNNVDIHNIGVLSLNGVTNTNGGFALDNIGNVTVTAPVHVGTFFNLTAHSDIVLQSDIFANTTGTVSGNSIELSASTDGTSDVTQAAGTTLNAGGASVNVGAGGTIGMSGSLTGSNLTTTTSGGSVALPTSNLTGSLTVSTSGGNITESGSLTVAGTTSLQAGTGTITLASSTNDFVGTVSATGTGGITLTDANTLTPGTVDAGTSTATLSASTLGSGGPVIASTATLSSNTPVTGLTTTVTNGITLSGTSTTWNLSNTVAGTPVTTTSTLTRVTVNDACASGCATTVTDLTGGTVNPTVIVTSTVTSSTQTSSTTSTTTSTATSPTLSFSSSLAPSAVSSPVQIVSAPTTTTTTTTTSATTTAAPTSSTSAPADTSTSTTTTASSSPSTSTSTSTSTSSADTSSSSTPASSSTTSSTSAETTQSASASPSSSSSSSSTSTSAETSSSTSSTSSSQSQGEGHSESSSSTSHNQSGGRQQQASTQRSGGQAGRGTALSATAARLVASMQELHAQKVQALEKAVSILERNPAAADLRPCAGAVSGDCIAPRPVAATRVAATLRRPTLANLPTIERKVALLIGVNDYSGAIPRLNSPLKDIQEIGKIYREQFGYEVRTLANADKATIVRALNRLIQESGPNDSVTVFYAGHGQLIEKTGRGYWIPARASADDPKQWISNQDIGKALENIPAKQVLLVSDSCYSGTLTRDAKVQRDEVLADPARVLERRSVTVLSSGGEEPVADAGRQGHSVFAWHYMQALKGVEKWSNGVQLHDRLAASVAKEFPQEPQYGEALGAGHQRGGDFLFEVRRY